MNDSLALWTFGKNLTGLDTCMEITSSKTVYYAIDLMVAAD